MQITKRWLKERQRDKMWLFVVVEGQRHLRTCKCLRGAFVETSRQCRLAPMEIESPQNP